MHCPTAWGQWAVELLQCTASLPGGSGQWNSCNALPHCLGAVDSATPAMHRLTAVGQWAVTLPQCTTSLPGGSGQWNSCNALPHCLGAVGSGTPAMHCLTALGAVGSATPAMHCLTAWGQWAVQLLQYTAALLGGSGQRNSCNALPHWLGGSGQWTSGNTLPHCLGAVSSAAPALLCPTAWGQWTVQLLQCTASLSGGSGQRNSCNALPHCPGAVGSGTPATHCLTAWEQWAVQLLQCTASLPGGSGQCNSCNGWSECSAGPVEMYYWAHRPGGMGSPTQGVVGASFRAYGGHHLHRTGRTGLGGTGSPGQGVGGASCRAHGEASSANNRAHRPGGDGEPSPGGWSEPPARPMGSHHLPITGRTGLGGTGSPAQGVVGASCKAYGGPPSSENRAHRPGGDGESSPGGVRSLLSGQWGAIFFREPGAPARGGWGVLPRGCSESPARANGGPSSSENRAHRPGGDGESCPGGVRSLLSGQWGAIFFRGPGAPARGGRGVLPRGCSESPVRPMGGHLLQSTERTGLGGTGSPAQGVFGVWTQLTIPIRNHEHLARNAAHIWVLELAYCGDSNLKDLCRVWKKNLRVCYFFVHCLRSNLRPFERSFSFERTYFSNKSLIALCTLLGPAADHNYAIRRREGRTLCGKCYAGRRFTVFEKVFGTY